MEHSIIKTICYADVFDFPLKIGELYTYLIATKPISHKKIHKLLTQSIKQGKIQETPMGRVGERENFYTLPNREKLVAIRLKNQKYLHSKIKIAHRVGELLKKIPTIKAIYITGSLAIQNVGPNDDVDLMIITASNRLWTTRVLVTLMLEVLGVRRKPTSQNTKDTSNKICANLYLDQSNLALAKPKQNLYTAHEVAQAKLLWERGDIHQQFLTQNRWVGQYLPHTPLPQDKSTFVKFHHKTDKSILGKSIEKICYKIQSNYMKKRQTQEKISQGSAFFHPKDTSQITLTKYQKILQNHG